MPKIRLKHAVEEIHKFGSELQSVSQSSHNYHLNLHNWWLQVYKSHCYSSCHNYSGLGSPRIWISRGMPSSFSPSTRLNSVMIVVFMLGCTDSECPSSDHSSGLLQWCNFLTSSHCTAIFLFASVHCTAIFLFTSSYFIYHMLRSVHVYIKQSLWSCMAGWEMCWNWHSSSSVYIALLTGKMLMIA
jgi:hypothetical protein